MKIEAEYRSEGSHCSGKYVVENTDNAGTKYISLVGKQKSVYGGDGEFSIQLDLNATKLLAKRLLLAVESAEAS